MQTDRRRGPVRLRGRLVAGTQSQRARVLAHLSPHVAFTRAEPGCLAFTVEATDDPYVWRVE